LGPLVRVWLLYVIGGAAVAYGFVEFWLDDVADQNAFVFGGVCIAIAAGVQVLDEIWRKLRR
jgi:hypothetical protein